MKIQKLTSEYLDRCIEIHQDAFKGFFLTFLGPRFLKVLYASISKDPTGIAFIVNHEEKVLGFAIGTTHVKGLYKRLLINNWYKFGLASWRPVLKKPSIVIRLLRAFALPGKQPSLPNAATLMSIAINTEYQGYGIGKMLMSAFFNEAIERGCTSVNLTTDAINNEITNMFYQKIGFEVSRSFSTPEGRKMHEYCIEL